MNQLFGQPADPMRSSDPDLGLAPPPARPLPVGGAEQAFFHLDVRRSLELNWRLALKIASAGVIFAVLYFLAQALWLKTWPSYESSSLVYVQPTPPRVLENNGAAPRWPYDTNTYETYILQQMMNVTRDDVLAAAVKKLPQFAGAHQSTQAAAQHLAALLSVDRQNSAYQFTISARAGTAQMAADIANAVTAAYMESATRDQRTGDAERMGMLRDERDRIQAALDADRTEQSTLNRQLGVASVNNTPDHYDEDIASTRTELVKARVDHDAAEAKFTALGAGKGPSSATIDAMADEMASSDAGLVSMKTALNGRRATLISQMANLTPGNPVYKQDEAELEKINADLESMMKNLRATAAARVQLQLKAELERTAGVESKVNGQLRQLVGAAGSATPKMQRSSDLAADITRLQARFSTVDEQLHNMMLEDNAPAAAYQVTPAEPPLSRTKSGVVRNSFLIAFAGIALGLLVAILVHKLDPRVRIAQDVELILGFPPMAQLPDFTEVSEGAADEFLLRLSSSIEHARKQSNLRSCVFTGAGPGVGVTMLVNRVGEMLDAMGRPTVRVDATGAAAHHRTARPEASASAAAASASGSATSIPGLVQADRYARPTAIFQQIAEETETQDDNLVLTDTMPLSVSAETEYLVRFVDCAIVVIESGKTTRRELRDAAATLQRLDVAAVGFVLNRVGLAKADPAFRSSIQAIEKHLRGQAGASARRSQRGKQPYVPEPDLVAEARPVFTSDAKPVFVSEAMPVSVAEPSVAQSHGARVEDDAPVVAAHVPSRYEPELASVAAAVARLSHPAVAPASAPAAAAPEHVEEAPASLPSPTVPSSTVPSPAIPSPAVEIAATPEPARRFSFADLFKPAASVPAPGAKTVSTEPAVEPARTLIPDSALSSAIKAAPFAEAARKLAASPTPELHAFRPSSSVARPFADVSDHFKSALFDSALFAPPVAPEVSADSAAESSAPVPGSAPSELAPAEAALVEHQAASSSSLDRARAEDANSEPAPADFATIPADVSAFEPAELSHAEYAAQAPPEQNVDPVVTPETSSLPNPAAADPWSAWIAGQTSAAAPIAPIHVPEVPVAQVDAPWWKSVATERSSTEELPVSTADTARLVTPQHGEAVESATALPGHEVSKHAPSALEATMESLNLHKHETESVHADDFDEFAAALTPLDAAASGPIPTAESSAAAAASVSDAAVLPPLSAAKELAEDDSAASEPAASEGVASATAEPEPQFVVAASAEAQQASTAQQPLVEDMPAIAAFAAEKPAVVRVEAPDEEIAEPELAKQGTDPAAATRLPAQQETESPWRQGTGNRNNVSARPPVLWRPARVWTARGLDVPAGDAEDAHAASRLAQDRPQLWPVRPGTARTQQGGPEARQAHTDGQYASVPSSWPLPGAPRFEAADERDRSPEEEASAAASQEVPASLTSRLSGLRNLLFVMGVKNAQTFDEPSERRSANGARPDFREEGDESGFDRAVTRDQRDSARHYEEHIGGAAPRIITAPAELLPPRPVVINIADNTAPTGESSTRQDRREAFDGVDILPSRKGQYRKI